jgi:hypothetical protein
MHAPMSLGTTQQTAPSRRLLTVRQLAERHPAFTEPALRSLIFKVSRDRSAVPNGDALEASLRRVGRRVLFDEGRFLEWVDVCSGEPPMR